MATKKTATKKKTAKTSTAKKKAPAPRGAPTLADLRRIARSVVTSTSVMDEKRMMALYSDSIESEEVAGGNRPAIGLDALKKKGEDWNKRVSDARWHARNLWCDGQTVIIEWEAHLAMKPGGRKVLHREVAIHEVRNGKIVRERFYYDPGPLG